MQGKNESLIVVNTALIVRPHISGFVWQETGRIQCLQCILPEEINQESERIIPIWSNDLTEFDICDDCRRLLK